LLVIYVVKWLPTCCTTVNEALDTSRMYLMRGEHMTESELSKAIEPTKSTVDQLKQRLLNDNSLAFLDDIASDKTSDRLKAQSTWWQTLDKDKTPAPAVINDDRASLEAKGWMITQPSNYDFCISRDSASGNVREKDCYDSDTKVRNNQSFIRSNNPEDLETNNSAQVVSLGFQDDGKTPTVLEISSGGFDSQFVAHFGDNSQLTRAEEYGTKHNFANYSFREDGSLSEAITRRRQDSKELSDVLFDSKGEQRSDYNPLYLYNKISRPIANAVHVLEWKLGY